MRKYLSTFLSYTTLITPLILPFVTFPPLGFLGYELPKVVIFLSFVVVTFCIYALQSFRPSLKFSGLLLVICLWIIWNLGVSFMVGSSMMSVVGDRYYLFGIFTVTFLLLYSTFVRTMLMVSLYPTVIRGMLLIGFIQLGSLLFSFGGEEHTIWNTRAIGTLGEPNWLGSFLLVPFIISTAQAFTKTRQRGLYTLSSLLFFIGILLTQSRSSLIVSVIGVILLFVLHQKTISAKKVTLMIASVLLFFSSIGFLAGWYANQSMRWIQQLPLTQVRGIAGTDSRIWIYQKGVKLFLQKPWGWGWEQIGTAYKQHVPDTYPGIENIFILRSHNLLLDLLLTGGIISAGLFAVIYGVSLYNGVKTYRKSGESFIAGSIIGMTVLLIYAQLNTLSIAHWVFLFFFIGILNKAAK